MLCKPAYSCVVFKCSSPICFAGAHVSVADVLNFFSSKCLFWLYFKGSCPVKSEHPFVVFNTPQTPRGLASVFFWCRFSFFRSSAYRHFLWSPRVLRRARGRGAQRGFNCARGEQGSVEKSFQTWFLWQQILCEALQLWTSAHQQWRKTDLKTAPAVVVVVVVVDVKPVVAVAVLKTVAVAVDVVVAAGGGGGLLLFCCSVWRWNEFRDTRSFKMFSCIVDLYSKRGRVGINFPLCAKQQLH